MPQHQINLYDFDHTIYDGDCTLDFYIFCLKRSPHIAFAAFRPLITSILFVLKLKTREQFKESFYGSFLAQIDAAKFLPLFWEENIHKIKDFYMHQKAPSDIIISASPYFVVKYAAEHLDVNLVASGVDPKTGKLTSKNCRGQQKVKMLEESGLLGSGAVVGSVYSDSLSDAPMARLGKRSFLVTKNSIKESSFDMKPGSAKAFFSLEFLRFIIVGGVNVLTGVISSSLLALLIDPLVAFLAGYIVSLAAGFLLMSKIVFDSSVFTLGQFIKYCAGYIPNFIIQAIVVMLLYSHLGINYIVSFFLAAVVSIPITFLVLKIKVF